MNVENRFCVMAKTSSVLLPGPPRAWLDYRKHMGGSCPGAERPRGRRTAMSTRMPSIAVLSKLLVLAIWLGLFDVGRGEHEQPIDCAVLESVNLPPDESVPSISRRSRLSCNNEDGSLRGSEQPQPGRFYTMNYDSPDPTIRTVLEYSQDEDFMDLPELFLNREELQQDVAMDPRGIDLEDNFVVDTTTGKVKAGRFIFSKQRPCEDFIFPRTRVLENGAVYYFKNYKVRGDCRSLDDHTQYPSEVLTRPYFLESQGFPSEVQELKHDSVGKTEILLSWLEPKDSGNNKAKSDVDGMSVTYLVTRVAQECEECVPKLPFIQVTNSTIKENISISGLETGRLYNFTVKVRNSIDAESQEVWILGRPIDVPDEPRDFVFRINPLNLTNATGNRMGLLEWMEPENLGLGKSCESSQAFKVASGCGLYPLLVDRYHLEQRNVDMAEDGWTEVPLDNATTQETRHSRQYIQYRFNVTDQNDHYRFRIAATNKQAAALGSSSGAKGKIADSAPDKNLGEPAGKPLKMRLLYSAWEASSSGGVGSSAERVVDPPQAQGLSDYCQKCTSTVASECWCPECRCPEKRDEDGINWVNWQPPGTCELCKHPELQVFVNSPYEFRVRATYDEVDSNGAFGPGNIRIESGYSDVSGNSLEDVVTLKESTWTCNDTWVGNDYFNTKFSHFPSDQEECEKHKEDSRTYGWKEVKVSFTASLDMAKRQHESEPAARFIFTAITPSNKRSKLVVNMRIIRPSPQFAVENMTLAHEITMGCTFSTDVTAADRTELGLSVRAAYENSYLVRIRSNSNGGLKSSRYRSTPFDVLSSDGGARLFPHGNTMPTNNPITYRFQWTPRRFQEGFTYVVQLEAIGYLNQTEVEGVGGEASQISLDIKVLRCRFCTETKDEMSLSRLASEWRASWLSIWSGNHVLVDVDTVEDTTVQLGPVFKVASTKGCNRTVLGDLCNDDLKHISSRYGVTVADLLWWNPDLRDEAGAKNNYQLEEDQEICVLPNTCISTGHVYTAGY